jgi:hypothetical protein
MGAIYKNFSTNSGSELDRLFHMQFKDCAAAIGKMDTIKKAEVAAQIQPILDSLYAQADRYGNPDYPKDEQISPDIFIYIMGKIKRWETILYWLYEIDIMMEETKLDEMIREAERRLEEHDYNDFDRIRYKEVINEEGKVVKQRTVVKASEDLAALYAERNARGNHTDEIIDMAKSLARRFFK